MRKLLLLLALVAVLGGSAIWYIKTPPKTASLSPDDFNSSGLDSESTADESEEVSTTTNTAVSTKSTTPTAPAGQTDTSASVDSELAELDSYYDASYDDSSLNGTFTSDGANTLTDPYDY